MSDLPEAGLTSDRLTLWICLGSPMKWEDPNEMAEISWDKDFMGQVAKEKAFTPAVSAAFRQGL